MLIVHALKRDLKKRHDQPLGAVSLWGHAFIRPSCLFYYKSGCTQKALFILLPIVFLSLSSNNVIFHANLDNFLSSFSMHYVIHVGTCWLNPLQFPHFSVHWMFFIKKSFKLSYGWRVIYNKNILRAVFV